MARLELRHIGVDYRTRRAAMVTALENVSITIENRSFVSLLGPSGCGKSTLLRVVAGLTPATRGEVLLDGVPVHEPSAERGMVFQAYTLFPWLTARQNVAFGLREKRVEAAQRARIADEYLALVGLSAFADAYPKELSGGMMQRVALARALANDPSVLLMDEPFGALDAQTRREMQNLLLDIWQRRRTTVLFVTHDVDEAILLSDRVCVLSSRPGRLLRDRHVGIGRPRSMSLMNDARLLSARVEILGALPC